MLIELRRNGNRLGNVTIPESALARPNQDDDSNLYGIVEGESVAAKMSQLTALLEAISEQAAHKLRSADLTDFVAGDELTIRFLAQEYDHELEGLDGRPIDVASESKLLDPVFGDITFDEGAWFGEKEVDFAPFDLLQLQVQASHQGPSTAQQDLYEEFLAGFESFWGKLSQALIHCHAEIESQQELERRIHPTMFLCFDDDPKELELCYSILHDSGSRAYVVTYRDGDVVDLTTAH